MANADTKCALKDAIAKHAGDLLFIFEGPQGDKDRSGRVSRHCVSNAISTILPTKLMCVSNTNVEKVIDSLSLPSRTSMEANDNSNYGYESPIYYDDWLQVAMRDSLARARKQLLHHLYANDVAHTGCVEHLGWRAALRALGYSAPDEFVDRLFAAIASSAAPCPRGVPAAKGALSFEELFLALRFGSTVYLTNTGYTGRVHELTARCRAPLRGDFVDQYVLENSLARAPTEFAPPKTALAPVRVYGCITRAEHCRRAKAGCWPGALAPPAAHGKGFGPSFSPSFGPRASGKPYLCGVAVSHWPAIEQAGGRPIVDTCIGWGGALEARGLTTHLPRAPVFVQSPPSRRAATARETHARHGDPTYAPSSIGASPPPSTADQDSFTATALGRPRSYSLSAASSPAWTRGPPISPATRHSESLPASPTWMRGPTSRPTTGIL